MKTKSKVNGWTLISDWYGNGRAMQHWPKAKRQARGCGRLWFVYHPDFTGAVFPHGMGRKAAVSFCHHSKPVRVVKP